MAVNLETKDLPADIPSRSVDLEMIVARTGN